MALHREVMRSRTKVSIENNWMVFNSSLVFVITHWIIHNLGRRRLNVSINSSGISSFLGDAKQKGSTEERKEENESGKWSIK